jgi:hypothetical protein
MIFPLTQLQISVRADDQFRSFSVKGNVNDYQGQAPSSIKPQTFFF